MVVPEGSAAISYWLDVRKGKARLPVEAQPLWLLQQVRVIEDVFTTFRKLTGKPDKWADIATKLDVDLVNYTADD